MHLRTRSPSVALVLFGSLFASVAHAEEAPLPWESWGEKPSAKGATPPAAKPAAAKPPAPKPAAPKSTPAVTPKPMATPAAPATGAAPATPAPRSNAVPSDFETRWRELEAALYRAGVLEPPHADGERRKVIESELAKLEAQQKSLDAAVKGGLELETVKPVLASISARTQALKAELATLDAVETSAPNGPKAPLIARLEALEAAVKALEARQRDAAHPTAFATPPASAPASAGDAAPDNAPPITAGYDDGFVLRSADGNFKLQPTGFLQVRFSHEWLEQAPDRTAFSLPRARAGFKGNVFTKDLKYLFLVDFGKGRTELSYYYLDYTILKDYVAVRAGVQKRPFSRLFLTGSEKLELVSSPVLSKTFGDAHDLGVVLHNGAPALEYAVGLFNGNGSKGAFTGDVTTDPTTGEGKVTSGDFSNVPERFHPTLLARVAFNHGDIQGYSDADLEGGPLRFSVGAAGLSDLEFDNDDVSALRGTVDAVMKLEGYSAQAGAFVSSKQIGKAYADRAYEASGLFGETGYVFAKRFQPVLRYTWLTPADPAFDTHEFAAGFNVYFQKHALKLQNEFDTKLSRDKDGPRKDFAFLTQAELMF